MSAIILFSILIAIYAFISGMLASKAAFVRDTSMDALAELEEK